MLRFSITQMLMGVGLVAILLMLVRSEGCGPRDTVIECLSFSPDGAKLLVSRLDSRRVGTSGNRYVHDEARTISVLAADAGNTTLVLHQDVVFGSDAPTLGQWQSGRRTASFDSSAGSIIVQDFSGDGIFVYPAEGSGPPQTVTAAKRPIRSLVVSKTAPRLAVMDRDGLALVDTDNDVEVRRIEADSPGYHGSIGAFSGDDSLLVTAGGYRVDVWNASAGSRKTQFIPSESGPSENAIALLPDDSLLVGSGRGLRRYDLAGNVLDLPRLADSCYGLDLSRDGRRLAALRVGAVEVFDVATWTVRHVQRAPGASCLALSPDGTKLAIGDLTGSVTLVDAATGQPLWSAAAPGWKRPLWRTPALLLAVWFATSCWLAARRRTSLTRRSSSAPPPPERLPAADGARSC